MEFDKIIEKRRSVRTFKSKPASWRAIVEAIDAARNIPLAGNTNTLRYLIVQKAESIDKIAEYANQAWINESSIVIVVCSDENMVEKMYGERGRVYSRQQAGAAIETILLKLVDLGLDACWVGAYDDKKIKRLLDIPERIQIEALIPVGYAKTKPSAKHKRPLKSIMFWEAWDEHEIPAFFPEPSEYAETAWKVPGKK